VADDAPRLRFCDELEDGRGFGWVADEFLERAAHALVADGGVWVLDPLAFPDAEERVRSLGEPRGVITLLDRHRRDSAEVAERLGVPHHDVPYEGVPGSPFVFLPVARARLWREVALWWPEPRVLACGDALGTTAYYRAGDERLAVHPVLRLRPPRALARLEPLHVLCGHGEGVHGAAAGAALAEALSSARRRLPQAWLEAIRRR
jgi:hypothetical protein